MVWTAGAAAAAALGAGSGCSTGSAARPRGGKALVGSQLYGWGQYYQRDGQTLEDHLDEVLSALRDCGYDYAEGSLDVARPENTLRFGERCRAKGLRAVALYTGARLHEAGRSADVVERTVAAARVAAQDGFTVVNCNPDPIGREKTDAELETQAAALDQLGEGLRTLGMALGVHNHTPEMVNGAREFHANFQKTQPRKVGFNFDVHWVYRGGVMPLDALAAYGPRVVSWHLRQSREAIWWEDLAEGDIDYEAVAAYARAHRLAPVYTVELALENGTKLTRSAVENHRRSREFVRRVFGA